MMYHIVLKRIAMELDPFKRLSFPARGAMIGNVNGAIKAASLQVGFHVGGVERHLRLHLAGFVFGRVIDSYNFLSDSQLAALAKGVSSPSGVNAIASWLLKDYLPE